MEIVLEENILALEEVTVTVKVDKEQPLNKLATVSARMLSSEEANRYAGTLTGDPARMVAGFAGVVAANDTRNDIIIRGNSPAGVLWRLDGFDIPNPNHFGAMGGTGGPIGMLNNNQLANSDFYTGAFPAEFGNLTSGLFDLRLRNGNSYKREYLVSMGFNGLELGAEGGFSAQSNASYLINARYSFLQSLEVLGFDLAGTNGGVPKYQDLSMKLNFPMKKSNLSLIVLTGASKINFNDDMTDTEEWMLGDLGSEIGMRNSQFFGGVNYTYRFNQDTRLENRISAQVFRSRMDMYTLGYMNISRDIYYDTDMSDNRVSYSSKLIKRINARNNLTAGIGTDVYISNLKDNDYDSGVPVALHNSENASPLFHSFIQWQHKFNDKLSILPGIHSQVFALNQDLSVEPRLGFQWTVNPMLNLGLSTGLYSKLQPLTAYFYEVNGEQVNTNLEMSRSWQSVFSVDKKFTSSVRVKAEAYYQLLYNIPVSPTIPQESLLNQGDNYIDGFDLLVNDGKGYNYGIELTVEKFFDNNWYCMITTSLYESKYRGYDQVLRDTKFNGNFAVNILAGYEFKVFANSLMSINIKTALMGNNHYTPVTSPNGIDADYDYSQMNALKLPNYFRTDFNINIKTNYKRFSLEYFIEIDNITNHKNVWNQYYHTNQQKYKYIYQQGFMPMGGMRLYW